MYPEALHRYEQLHESRKWGVESHIAMKRVAQLMLENEMLEVRSLQMKGAYEQALNKLAEAEEVQKRYEFLAIKVPSIYFGIESDIKGSWVNDLYSTAENLVLHEQYDLAEEYINQIYRIDRDNQRAEYLELMSRIYPNYNKGKKAFELRLYREAHAFFRTVTDIDADFKDALELLEESRAKASFTIAYVPIHKYRLDASVEVAVATLIKEEILSSNNPFLRLLDRESLDELINEQRNSMSASFDDEKVVQAGRLEGAQYVLTGEFLHYTNFLGNTQRQEKKGFIGKSPYSDKVKYNECSQERAVSASFKYQLINVETGEIHASGNIPVSDRDRVVYATYKGDPAELYAGNWKSRIRVYKSDVVYSSEKEKADLDQKFSARRQNKSLTQMEHEMIDYIACEVANKVVDFSPLD
jgi:hypothetical protein